MHYATLWRDFFKAYLDPDLESTKGYVQRENVHIPWIYETGKPPDSFRLYETHGAQVPTATQRGLKDDANVYFENRGVFDARTKDTISFWVMHCIYFTHTEVPSSKLFCSYVEGINSTIFCLWQCKHKMIVDNIDTEFFAASSLSYHRLGCTTSASHRDDTESKKNKILKDGKKIPDIALRSIDDYKQGQFVFHDFTVVPSMFSDISLKDDMWSYQCNNADKRELISEMHDYFSSIRDEMLVAQTLLLGDWKKGCHHRITLYSDIKANWSSCVSRAFEKCPGFSEMYLHSVWLWIRGCPEHIISCADFLADIKKIALNSSEKEYLYLTFINNLVKNGYHASLACLICHSLEATELTGFAYKQALLELTEPFDIGCILTGDLNERLHCVRYTPSKEDIKLPCDLTYYNSLEKDELLASPFDNVVGWTQFDFIRALYERIQNLLKENPNCTVLGHITSQKHLMRMCYPSLVKFKNVTRTHYGVSVFATANNKYSCGHGMYFFEISERGNFVELARDEADRSQKTQQKQIQEFQGFLYAMTRRLETASAQWAACVLLSVIERDHLLDAVDTSTKRLNLIETSTGVRRYDEDWNVKHEEEAEEDVSTEDIVAIIEYIASSIVDTTADTKADTAQLEDFNAFSFFGWSTSDASADDATHIVASTTASERIEQINLLSLLAGVVDFTRNAPIFRGYVADGKDCDHLILTPDKLRKKERQGQLQIHKVLNSKFDEPIQHWRVPYSTLLYKSIHRISMKEERCKTLPPNWSPRDVVITEQERLQKLFRQAKKRYVFYVQNVQNMYSNASLPKEAEEEWGKQRELISKALKSEDDCTSAAGTDSEEVKTYHQYYKLKYQRNRNLQIKA